MCPPQPWREIDAHDNEQSIRADLHLGLVVRVGELRVQYKTERRVVLDLLVTHLDGATFLDGVAADDGIKDRVDGFLDVLDEDRLSRGHGVFNHVQVVLESKTHDRQTTGVTRLYTHSIQYISTIYDFVSIYAQYTEDIDSSQ